MNDKDIINIFKDIESKKIIKWIEIIQSDLIDLSYNVNCKIWLDSLYSKIIGGTYD